MPANLQGSYERVNISASTRTLLCVWAAGDFAQPLTRVEADWVEVFDAVCQNGLIGLTYHYLEQHGELDYPPATFRQQIQNAYRALVIRMNVLYRHIAQVMTWLTNAGIETIVVKGPALAQQIYAEPMLRSFNDLDLIVHERAWRDVHRVLTENGFVVEEDFTEPPPKLIPQLSPYEIKYWHRTTKLLVEVHYEDLYNTGLAARDVDGFWQRAQRCRLGDLVIQVPSLEDQLIHACTHLHYHGYTRLNWFSDLAMMVRDHAAQLDWERVIAIARTEEIQVGVYYSLYFLERLLNVAVPRAVLDALRPDRFRRWWHEFYLPADKVLSLRRMTRPIFSFYFLPLLNRLLPDLLVMGRRKEKLGYLMRLVLPPREWLRSYYQVSDPRLVPLHYVLHPLKLAYHYLVEIIAALLAFRRRDQWLTAPPPHRGTE